jgi:hypothetical protein
MYIAHWTKVSLAVAIFTSLLSTAPARAAEKRVSCRVDEVGLAWNRVHVYCGNLRTIKYFALPANDVRAPLVLSVAQGAIGLDYEGFSRVCIGGGEHGADNPTSEWWLGCNHARGNSDFTTEIEPAGGSDDNITIIYDPKDTSGNSWGCNKDNCRKIRAIFRNK